MPKVSHVGGPWESSDLAGARGSGAQCATRLPLEESVKRLSGAHGADDQCRLICVEDQSPLQRPAGEG
eukprot:7682879-Pyramimonas_sp.AAC.1